MSKQVSNWVWDATNEKWVKLAGTSEGAMSIHALVEELNDIEDVNVPAPGDGEGLVWDDATSKWIAAAVGITAHKDTHDPEDGSDKLDTAAPVKVGEANAVGTSHSLARADHVHEKHHAKYTDAEAVTAMGVKGDANPLHHDRAEEWGATEHTAIGDNAPHHAKYTNAEAVAAAKTVKLDDLTTPDDTSDLDASAALHGLMPKADKGKLDDATDAATASKLVIRDASARAKFAAPDAAGDALIKGTRVTTAELPAMTDEKIWKGTGTNVEEVDVYTDAAAKAAAVLAGAITDAETKAPTHDAVYDVKVTADGAIAKSLLTTKGDIIKRGVSVPEKLAIGSDTQKLWVATDLPAWISGKLINFITPTNPHYMVDRRSSSPQTATVSSISGDTITLTSNVADYFWEDPMDGASYLKITNTTRSEIAWVFNKPAANQLQVVTAADIAAWVNGNNITSAEDGASSAYQEYDLTPNANIPSGAVAIWCRIFLSDSGTIVVYKGIDAKDPAGTGASLWCYPQVSNLSNLIYGFISIDSNKKFWVRDRATGTDTLNGAIEVLGYLI